MPTLNGRNFTGVPGLNIRANNGCIRFETPTITPTTTSGERLLYVNSSNELIFDDGSSTTTLGGVGSGATPTWETLYAADGTMALTTATWTITQSAAASVLTLNKTNASTGTVLSISNSGTGSDIANSTNWSIKASGGVGVLELSSGGTINATGGACTIGAAGTATTFTGTATVSQGLTITTGGVTSSDGQVSVVDNSNTASSLLVTNDTVTTYGIGGTSTGVALFRSTSLTTGTLVRFQLTENTLNNGYYFDCWDVSGGSAVFTVAENGVTTIAGDGSNVAFTITAGHAVLTAGNLTLSNGVVAITSTGTADVVSITDNSLLANNALIVQGSGTFTGTTTSSFVAITPTGLSTGTALYIAAAAATTASICVDVTTSTTTGTALRLTTTGTQVDGAATGVLTMVADSATTAGATVGRGLVSLSADALTTGTGLDVTSTSLNLAAGELANFEHIASGTIAAAKTGQLVDVTSSRTHTAATSISDDYDALSIIRTNVCNNAGGTLNAAGAALYVSNISTQTAGTLGDTANGIEVVMTGGAESQGYGLSITHSGTTVGRAINVVASQTTSTVMLMTMDSLTTTGVGLSIAGTDTGLTSGSMLRVSTGTTAAVATNGIVSFVATGAHTSTSNCGFVHISDATATGTAVDLAVNALTSGVGMYLASSGTGTTSGSLLRVVSATTGAVATNGLFSVQATGAYTSTSNVGALSVLANATTAGTVAYLSATSMVGGTILFLNATAATLTGKYIQCYDGAADDFSVGQYGATIIAGNAGSTVLTATAGDVSFADGSLTIADNDNAATVSITNDTATTIGAGVNGGVVDISGDGLTTGTLLNLSVTEGTLNGGHYLKCWDVTAGVAVASIEEDGELNIAGGRATTAGGADAINIGSSAAIKILWGSGVPTASAPQGSLYLRTDGTTSSDRIYVNSNGSTTWKYVTTEA